MPKNGKVEFSSTVKPFYDHPLTEKYLPKAKLFVNYQKNTPLACSLTSAEAVNGMRVV